MPLYRLHFYLPDPDDEFSILFHGFNAVDNQIDKNLHHLAAVNGKSLAGPPGNL